MPLTEILEGVLWQSDTDPSIFAKLLQRGLTPALVIDLQEFPQPDPPANASITYIRWPIEDGPLPDVLMLATLKRAASAYIHRGGHVVTMCAQGRNRSGLVSALIVMQLRACNGREAVRIVRAKVPEALSNSAFVAWLERGSRMQRARIARNDR